MLNYEVYNKASTPCREIYLQTSQSRKRTCLKAIAKLPDEGDIKRLQGHKNPELFRLRVGDYRIIYTVDNGELVVLIVDAGNRGDIYKRY